MPKVHTKSNTATKAIHCGCRRGSTCNRHACILLGRLRERTTCVNTCDNTRCTRHARTNGVVRKSRTRSIRKMKKQKSGNKKTTKRIVRLRVKSFYERVTSHVVSTPTVRFRLSTMHTPRIERYTSRANLSAR